MFATDLMIMVQSDKRATEAQTKASALKSTAMQLHVRMCGTAFLSEFRRYKHGS